VRVTTHALDGDNAVSILYTADVHEKFGRGGLNSLMKRANRMRFVPALITLLLVVMMAVPAMSMAAAPTVPLGRTEHFAVLAGTTITNTGPTVISGDAGGDIGVSPGSAITGFPPGTFSGTSHSNDALAIGAETDWVTAYNNAVGRPVTAATPVDLSGLTLGPGVYSSGGALSITGTLTLDGHGDSNSVFILKSDSTLILNSGSAVRLINGARFCRVFWPVASSATLDTGSTFVGHIFAVTDISVKTGATVQGQLLAQNGEVTLDTNRITNGSCATELPVIHITKTVAPKALTSGPGWVTYSYIVTNPGTVALSNVSVTDDKVGSVTYVSGDTNHDKLLQPSETWTYTARVHLTATTKNIAVARGSGNGATATATSVVTVVVAGELLPNTATPWYNILLAGAVLALIGAVGFWRTTRKIYD
jgi:type VI secretion system secreted protein VgrG